MAAIEERDGAAFYVERTSPVRADLAGAHARLQSAAPRARQRRRDLRVPAGRRAQLDVLLVSLGSTAGLRRADEQLRDALRARRRDASQLARARRPRPLRTLALTDLAWARAARAAAHARALSAAARPRPRGGDLLEHHRRAAVAAPGRDPLRRARRRQPARAPRPLAASARAPPAGARRCCCRGARARCARRRRRARAAARALVVPVAVEPSGAPAARARHRGDHLRRQPAQEGASTACSRRGGARARLSTRRAGEPRELVVAGADAARARDAPASRAGEPRRARRSARSPTEEYRALLRRGARVRVRAPPRGLRDRPAGGAGRRLHARHHARARARTWRSRPHATLDPRLVGEDLAAALRAALDEPLPDYAERARARARAVRAARRSTQRGRRASCCRACSRCASA